MTLSDEEFIIALEIESLLLDAGASMAGVYTTVAEALTYARDGLLSVATLDIRLGRETTAKIAEHLCARGIPFLFFSGQPLPAEMQGLWPCSPLSRSLPSQGN